MRARKMPYLMRAFDARNEEPLTADVRGYGLGKSVDLASRAGFEGRVRERLPQWGRLGQRLPICLSRPRALRYAGNGSRCIAPFVQSRPTWPAVSSGSRA